MEYANKVDQKSESNKWVTAKILETELKAALAKMTNWRLVPNSIPIKIWVLMGEFEIGVG